MLDTEIPEIEFLRNQDKSTWIGGSATWSIPKVCHQCGESAKILSWDAEALSQYICNSCAKERRQARDDLREDGIGFDLNDLVYCDICEQAFVNTDIGRESAFTHCK